MKLANLSIGKRLALGFGAVGLMLVLISDRFAKALGEDGLL